MIAATFKFALIQKNAIATVCTAALILKQSKWIRKQISDKHISKSIRVVISVLF